MKDGFVNRALNAVAGCMTAGVTVSDRWLHVTTHTLTTGKPGGPVVCAVFSDLHFARFGADQHRLLRAVAALLPDLILLPGDIFDTDGTRSNLGTAVRLLRSLTALAPVYMSPGNHDKRFDARTGRDCLALARACGVRTLDGAWEDVEINGRALRVGGIYDYAIYEEDYGDRWPASPVYRFLTDFSATDRTTLALMHRPNTFIFTDDAWPIDAVFSGHTHGGLWKLPGLGGVFAPEQGFLPEYDSGEFTFGDTRMFLGAGLDGFSVIPRLLNRPEILRVEIR